MQFHLIVVSIFLKNVCERSYRLLWSRKKDLISMYHGALVSGFVNISVYFNKLVDILTCLIDFFKKN